MSRRLLLIALALATLGLAACGGDETETITSGEGEAFYVTNGDLQYQVQISRQINPDAVGDRDYLVGIPPDEQKFDAATEIWFGVFVRAFNRGENPVRNADEFRIVDTRGREFEPIELENTNVFRYRSALVVPEAGYPPIGSAASDTSSTGALLLFKLPVEALSFRPLELEFDGTPGSTGTPSTITLDV